MASIVAAIEGGIADALDATGDLFSGIAMVTGIADFIDAIIELIMEVIDSVEDGIDDIVDFLEVYMETIELIETMLGFLIILMLVAFIIFMVIELTGNLGTGIHNHVKCGAREFNYGGENFAFTVKVMWDCMWDKLILFFNGKCTVYYLIDIIFGIVYAIIVELPIVLIRAIFGINLQPIVNDIYTYAILPINDVIELITGFSIVQWDKEVIDKCFRCKGVYKTSTGQNITLYKTFNQWAQLNNCNLAQMRKGFVKIFQSILPSPKWGAWMNGQELPGWTNNPPF
jgi:hypothetical protein